MKIPVCLQLIKLLYLFLMKTPIYLFLILTKVIHLCLINKKKFCSFAIMWSLRDYNSTAHTIEGPNKEILSNLPHPKREVKTPLLHPHRFSPKHTF